VHEAAQREQRAGGRQTGRARKQQFRKEYPDHGPTDTVNWPEAGCLRGWERA